MAIGSDPEIGTEFSRWGDMDQEARLKWFSHVRNNWGPDLMGDYGKVCFPNQELVDHYKTTTWTLI